MVVESQVDLLGDEVETLLDLLEKIYIALDHYSPVLKHYPGVSALSPSLYTYFLLCPFKIGFYDQSTYLLYGMTLQIIEILKLVRRELSGEAKRPPAD